MAVRYQQAGKSMLRMRVPLPRRDPAVADGLVPVVFTGFVLRMDETQKCGYLRVVVFVHLLEQFARPPVILFDEPSIGLLALCVQCIKRVTHAIFTCSWSITNTSRDDMDVDSAARGSNRSQVARARRP